MVQKYDVDAEQYEKEEKLFAERKRIANNKAESLKRFLLGYLDGDKFETTKVKISLRKSKKLDIAPGTAIPEDFTKVMVSADKATLKKAIESANDFVTLHHRHHASATGCRFCVSLIASSRKGEKLYNGKIQRAFQGFIN